MKSQRVMEPVLLLAWVAEKFYKFHPEGTGTHCRFLLAANLRRDALTGTRSGEGSIQQEGKEGHWRRYCCRSQRHPILKYLKPRSQWVSTQRRSLARTTKRPVPRQGKVATARL